MTPRLKTYTAFCRDAERAHPTTWIGNVEATSVKQAKQKARKACAEDWQCKAVEVHVMGIAAGDVTILEWED